MLQDTLPAGLLMLTCPYQKIAYKGQTRIALPTLCLIRAREPRIQDRAHDGPTHSSDPAGHKRGEISHSGLVMQAWEPPTKAGGLRWRRSPATASLRLSPLRELRRHDPVQLSLLIGIQHKRERLWITGKHLHREK